MKRSRTLSDEGVKLFSNGMGGHPHKSSVRRFLFSCFHSDYDDKLRDVVFSCREATKALYYKLITQDPCSLNQVLDAGISNATKLLLTADSERVRSFHIRKNYRFFLDVMERAFNSGDHQTAMLMYLALTHSSVARLDFKRPKKTRDLLDILDDSYGDLKTCYSKHIKEMVKQTDIDYLPSVIAISMFTCRFTGNGYSHVNSDLPLLLEDLKSVIQLYGMLNFREENIIQLYSQDQLASSELFNLSETVQPVKKRQWNYNPTFVKNKCTK